MKPQRLDTIDLLKILKYMKRKVGQGSPNAFTAGQLMISRVLEKKIPNALGYEEVLQYLTETGYLTKLSKKENEIKPRYALEVDAKKLKHTKPLYALKVDPKKLKHMNPHIRDPIDAFKLLRYMKRKVDEGNPNAFSAGHLMGSRVLQKKIHDALGYEEVLEYLTQIGHLTKLSKKEDERKPRYALEESSGVLDSMEKIPSQDEEQGKPVRVFDVAQYIINTFAGSDPKITAMKLQKLLYYCQAWSLAWKEKPLFMEDIQAWSNGPVIQELYDKHRGMFYVENVAWGDVSVLTEDQKKTIDHIIKDYGNKTSCWLSDLAQLESPWREARKGLSPKERGSRVISLALLHEYYSTLAPLRERSI